MKKHTKALPKEQIKVGDRVEIIGEYQPEVYEVVCLTTDRKEAILTWFGDYFGKYKIDFLAKIKANKDKAFKEKKNPGSSQNRLVSKISN